MPAEPAKPLSAVLQENPAGSPSEWGRRLEAVLNDPPISERDRERLNRRLQRPSVLIGAMELSCGAAVRSLQENLEHRNARVSNRARQEVLRLLAEVNRLLLDHPVSGMNQEGHMTGTAMDPLPENTIQAAMEVLKAGEDVDLLVAAHRLRAMNEAVPHVQTVLMAADALLASPTWEREADLQDAIELARVYYPEI